VGGESDHGVVLGWFDKTYRPTDLEPGEAKMYTKFGQTIYMDMLGQITLQDQAGSTLTLKANGDIQAAPASGLYKVTGELHTTSHIVCGGDLTVALDLQAANMSASNDVSAGNDVTAAHDVSAANKVIAAVDVLADTVSLKTHKHGGVVVGGGQTGVPV
jgi:phage gp45-like